MRGKVKISNIRFQIVRITPAYAGKRCTVSEFQTITEDHPRLCGEKHDSINNHTICIRITPAYAGKSSRFCFPMNPSQDHPRLCGEKASRGRVTGNRRGSPPPMRGKAAGGGGGHRGDRITPAYAGKSRN